MQGKFNINKVIGLLDRLTEGFDKNQDIQFDQFCDILSEFCMLFKQFSTFLGIAFSDVVQKRESIKKNRQIYPEPKGFFEFIKMEMAKGIQTYNAKSGQAKKPPKQMKQYSSTSRNLLRMMWLFTFIRVTFEQVRDESKYMSDVLYNAYDSAFGEKHGWATRQGAKIAIMACGNRKTLIQEVMADKYDQNKFLQTNERFLKSLIPIHQTLWNFYRKNNLTNLQ